MPSPIAPYTAAVVQCAADCVAQDNRIRQDLQANAERMIGWIRRIAGEVESPPRLYVFPVLPLVGASKRPVPAQRTSFRLTGPLDPVLDMLVSACANYNCYIAMTVTEMDDTFTGGFLHSGIILGPDGLVLRQPKFMQHHAYEIETIRERYFRHIETHGEAATHRAVDTPIGRLSCIIEVEHWVPEAVRARAQSGAEVICHPNLEFRDVDAPFTALKQSLAFQQSVYLLSTNAAFERWAEPDKDVFRKGRGDSMIVGPTGRILGMCDQGGPNNGEAYAVATIDLSQVHAARERYGEELTPVWDLYARFYAPRDDSAATVAHS